ncbi:MAG: putative peptide modification system cyclase [Pseudomonadota bacterium]|nr:putative peptide modification system cyclase [Pseudomonadota bacterium]
MKPFVMPASERHAAEGAERVLRTLLLTDLCNSTEIVEKLGDVRSADLFRSHDEMVLGLQKRWMGRLIDRSDGLLLMFERPVDGLGFGLDYMKAVKALGQEFSIKLMARGGLHVGEVLAWRNSREAVRMGAKPLEVEGLAKPMAARLAALALPGQLLVSAVAEPLAHHAARELGERGEHLLWKSHGRWCFKGVPGNQEIHEVGEAGAGAVAPLRMPKAGAKAWRKIPLWRRPASLLAEAAVLLVVGISIWFMMRPEPAIAFAERDWVVIGDMRNLTGDVRLDDSLEQAFKISLEQSRYINVVSDLKARETLARMRRDEDGVIDRSTASEIALRDGARVVILPSVAEVGGRLRISLEVIDPHSQNTIHVESADGRGIDSLLGSVDAVTGRLRRSLGEAMASIDRDSRPLPMVTTTNIEALRAYALARAATANGDSDAALRLYQQATTLDPEFAMAWLGKATVWLWRLDPGHGLQSLHKAQALADRMPNRERMYLDGVVSSFDDPGMALEKWRLLAEMYPDYTPGMVNAAGELRERNRFAEAISMMQAAINPHNPMLARIHLEIGKSQLGLQHWNEADTSLAKAYSLGLGNAMAYKARVAAARGNYAMAARLQNESDADAMEHALLALARADWAKARAQADKFADADDSSAGIMRRSAWLVAASAESQMGQREAALHLAHKVNADALQRLRSECCAMALDLAADISLSAELAARIGDTRLLGPSIEALAMYPQLRRYDQVEEMAALLEGRRRLALGDAAGVMALLSHDTQGAERYQTHVLLLEAARMRGDDQRALAEARWLQANRGRAWMESGAYASTQALAIIDSILAIKSEAELLDASDPSAAAAARMRFQQAWPSVALVAGGEKR